MVNFLRGLLLASVADAAVYSLATGHPVWGAHLVGTFVLLVYARYDVENLRGA